MRTPDTIRLIAGLSAMAFLTIITLKTATWYGLPDSWLVTIPIFAGVFLFAAGAVLARNYRIRPEHSSEEQIQ
ncbi:MAG: hypothetical protein WCJ93_08350 [Methanomicrobiales archaeon]